jgi:hypothetical protein
MKKMLFILICMCLASITQAVMVGFEAEDDSYYSIAGGNWQTLEDEAALGGAYITAITTGSAHNAANDRHYEIPLQAGSYNVYIHVYTGPDTYNDDSVFVPNNAFGAEAGMADWNNTVDDALAGEDVTESYGWSRLEGSYSNDARVYTLASNGTAVWKFSTRENGFRIDAFVFVTAEQTVTPAELTQAVIDSGFRRGAATDPVPDGKTLVDSQVTTAVSWTAPVDPNLVSVSYDVYFGTDPNIIANPVTSVTTESLPVTLVYDTTYYWRVDSHVVWDSNDISGTGSFSQTVEGFNWFFTTLPDDLTPVITANDVLTSIPYLPAALTGTVNDSGEDDIATVTWEFLGTAAVPAAKQMITRTQSLSAVTADPNLLMDWIGTDTREVGEPMYLSLKGLPAGTYNWLSYHHDAESQNGIFDVTVYDASGTTETTGIAYRNGNSLPVITVPLTITSNGTDDVILTFDLQSGTFFVMNGFELTKGVDSLNIDFGSDPNNVMSGYQEYQAQHEVPETFTEQSYSAFGTTVSILPTWAGITEGATVADTTNNASSASQTATFNAEWPGSYLVRLSATDNASQTGSDTLVVRVVADACAAAQLSTSWSGFSGGDFNEDCVVNLEDFASLAAQWLDDRNMTAQE